MSEAMPRPPREAAEGDDDLIDRLGTGETPLGQILRQRREALGLSVKDAALRLDVASAQIEAVEQDDYQRFAAPIYARNFLRRYAQLLELPVEAVLAAYERQAHPEPPPLKRVSLRQQVTTRHTPVRWTTVLLALLLIALVGAWWWSMRQAPAPAEAPAPTLQPPSTTQP